MSKAKQEERRTFKERIKCTLTDEELIEYSKTLAAANQDHDEVEADKGHMAAEFKAREKKIEADISLYSRKVSDGYEFREIECYWDYDWKRGRKRLIRTDMRVEVDALVRETEITADERQVHLPETATV